MTYADLWPGIDLVYTGAGGQLKYTFLVKPGADPNQIRLAYRGATGVQLTDAGELAVSTPVGGFRDERPYAYQEGWRPDRGGGRLRPGARPTAGGLRFRLGDYDGARRWCSTPSCLVYAGYLGGAGVDEAHGIAVDGAGNAYVTGTTTSTEATFPVRSGPT